MKTKKLFLLLIALILATALVPTAAFASHAEKYCLSDLGMLSAAASDGSCPILNKAILLSIDDSVTEVSVSAEINADGTIASQSKDKGMNWITSSSYNSSTGYILNFANGVFANHVTCAVTVFSSGPGILVSTIHSESVSALSYSANSGIIANPQAGDASVTCNGY
ncbi:hypothetical protein [Dyella silvatica]|uniref:hypothetical protein n=1 Tax=Dyella silvatica TaxID=2992128 RepID=UPI00225958F4|nr:hypothetical protein [Dyella silvatica]